RVEPDRLAGQFDGLVRAAVLQGRGRVLEQLGNVVLVIRPDKRRAGARGRDNKEHESDGGAHGEFLRGVARRWYRISGRGASRGGGVRRRGLHITPGTHANPAQRRRRMASGANNPPGAVQSKRLIFLIPAIGVVVIVAAVWIITYTMGPPPAAAGGRPMSDG